MQGLPAAGPDDATQDDVDEPGNKNDYKDYVNEKDDNVTHLEDLELVPCNSDNS